MLYSQFLSYVQAGVQSVFGPQAQVSLHKIHKNNNIVFDGLTVLPKGQAVSPTVYLNSYYQDFLDGMPPDEIVESVCSVFRESQPRLSENLEALHDFQSARPRIIYRLVNYRANRKLLTTIPHRQIMDLAIIYCLLAGSGPDGEMTVKITNKHMRHWKVTENILFSAASQNTPLLFPSQCLPLSEILQEAPLGAPLYVLTNFQKQNGAACILYEKLLSRLAKRLAGSFYLLPSSIHEFILLPNAREAEEDSLRAMVREVNAAEVSPWDRLSGNIYYYSRPEDELRICKPLGSLPLTP